MSDVNVNEVTINGVTYTRKDSNAVPNPATNVVVIRGDRSGAFYGELVKLEGTQAELKNARRIWYWDGAASLSQLAEEGVKAPDNCKFPCPVKRMKVLDVIEVLDVTPVALASLNSVKIWKR